MLAIRVQDDLNVNVQLVRCGTPHRTSTAAAAAATQPDSPDSR
jgi:hypothetical protein